MGFANAPVGNQGVITRPKFCSSNYVAGVSGWAIFKNGNAEFNNGVFRGFVNGGAFVGTDFIVDSSGMFFYTGPQAFTLALLQKINNAAYVVEANEFGSAAAYTLTGTTGSPYGFTVATSSINNIYPGSPGAYAHIYCGYHYGTNSPDNPFPLLVSGITSGQVKTSLNVTLANTGISDCVYDNWFNTASVPAGGLNSANGLEMMIWLASVGGTGPPGSMVGTSIINGYTFNVWYHASWANADKGTVSYQHQSNVTNVTYDMRSFMDDMIQRGYLQKTWYLIAIEAGFELWVGGAGHTINSFSVSNAPALPVGNLITSIAPVAGTDFFGNAFVDGVIEGLTGQTQVGFRVVSNVAELIYIIPGFTNGLIAGGQSGSFSFLEYVGPANLTVGFRDKVFQTFFSSDGVSSSANTEWTYQEDNGTQHTYMVIDNTGVQLLPGRISARAPGSVPATVETWHSFAPLATGYNITGGYADYSITAEGKTALSAHILVTSGPGLSFIEITSTPLPAAYRPSVDRYFAITTNELAIFAGSNNAGAIGKLATTGRIYVYGASTFATEIDFEVQVRL